MKFSILQEKLKEGLHIVERAASKSLTLPILNNILLSEEKNFLTISSTDLEIGIRWWALIKGEQEGVITVPARLFSYFIDLLPSEKISIEVKNDTLFVTCGNYKTQIKGTPADEFPIIPKIPKDEFVFIDAAPFCQGLSQVADIPTHSTTRPEISGVYFLFQKNLLTVAATDSFRLTEKQIPLKNDATFKKEYSFILPQKTAKEIITIFGEKEGKIKMYFSPNQIMLELPMEETDHPSVQLTSRLIDGEYPNYKEIIPPKHTTRIAVRRDEFINQIKTASLFSGKINEIKLTINPQVSTIEIESRSAESGEHHSSLSGKTEGETIEISFNHRFLLDGLLGIKSAEVLFEFNGTSGPGVLKPVGDSSYLYVIMPIKAS